MPRRSHRLALTAALVGFSLAGPATALAFTAPPSSKQCSTQTASVLVSTVQGPAWTSPGVTVSDGGGFVQFVGTSGDDVIVGTDGDDLIYGYEGNDTACARKGNDAEFGDNAGNVGNDYLAGGNGNDQIQGKAGNDVILGVSDADIIYGGTGDDTIRGGGAGDTIYGGSDNDSIFGDSGADSLDGDGLDPNQTQGIEGTADTCDGGGSQLDQATTNCETRTNVEFVSDGPPV